MIPNVLRSSGQSHLTGMLAMTLCTKRV